MTGREGGAQHIREKENEIKALKLEPMTATLSPKLITSRQ